MTEQNSDFLNIYNKSYRLVAAVFTVSNLMDENEELRTKIKKLSLDLVSKSVDLKDVNFSDAKKLTINLEKICLELISMLDIASIAGLISKMNGDIIRDEFYSFISELNRFVDRFENYKNVSVKNIFRESSSKNIYENIYKDDQIKINSGQSFKLNQPRQIKATLNGGHKRKEIRKNTILEFVKGHKNVSIKDIVPNIVGCSEKTVQRELISLVGEGKIIKSGERRWSRYSIA